MTTYTDKHQHINLRVEDKPNNDYGKILKYNKEVGNSAKLPTGTKNKDDFDDANIMTDMWVKVEEKIKMCRYDNNEIIGQPIHLLWKYYGNGNHILLATYENNKKEEYVMIKGRRHYLEDLKKAYALPKNNWEWDYHYHYSNVSNALMGLPHVEDEEVEEGEDIVIHRTILEELIKKNQQIYNKNIELSIALMKTTAVLEELLKV